MRKGAIAGLTAAVLFGLSTPLSRLLLPEAGPLLLAGLLYLGGGLGLSAFTLFRRGNEARLQRADWPLLFGITFLGGVCGPLLMLFGLGRLGGVATALLLNLEAPFTILIALLVFGEHLGRREGLGAAAILLGAAALTRRDGSGAIDLPGALAIAGACLCWAMDNNLTQRLSLRDPVAVVRFKALGAGTCNLVFAWAMGSRMPGVLTVAAALVVGSVSYGGSLLLDMYALRLVGAAREAAYFAAAPFIGAIGSALILKEPLGGTELLAGLVMALGLAMLILARHGHVHTHAEIEHEHVHVHDEHHRHRHEGPVTEPHSHVHRHTSLTHDHPHVSDLHHRHTHA